MHCLGTEGQRILGQTRKYKDATKLLEAHFAAPQTVILRRIVFRQRKQKAGESVQHYIADLRSLAVFCMFGDMKEEMIRDQLAEHPSQNSGEVKGVVRNFGHRTSFPSQPVCYLSLETFSTNSMQSF